MENMIYIMIQIKAVHKKQYDHVFEENMKVE